MKTALYILFLCCSFTFISAQAYDTSLVEISTLNFNGDELQVIKMNRKGGRIKAKYFAAKDFSNNKSVYERFLNWKTDKNIIAYSSGTYTDQNGTPEGLTIDNGIVINKSKKEWDGLAIVYATGGIMVTNIKEGNLTITHTSNYSKQTVDLKNQFQLEQFIQWAEAEEATVFQAHLLIYKNELIINDPTNSNCSSCKNKRERRFLAGIKDKIGQIHHIIINNKNFGNTLYNASLNAFEYLKSMNNDILFMINLEDGYEDNFILYKSDGTPHPEFKSRSKLLNASNLLVYYYE